MNLKSCITLYFLKNRKYVKGSFLFSLCTLQIESFANTTMIILLTCKQLLKTKNIFYLCKFVNLQYPKQKCPSIQMSLSTHNRKHMTWKVNKYSPNNHFIIISLILHHTLCGCHVLYTSIRYDRY